MCLPCSYLVDSHHCQGALILLEVGFQIGSHLGIRNVAVVCAELRKRMSNFESAESVRGDLRL